MFSSCGQSVMPVYFGSMNRIGDDFFEVYVTGCTTGVYDGEELMRNLRNPHIVRYSKVAIASIVNGNSAYIIDIDAKVMQCPSI